MPRIALPVMRLLGKICIFTPCVSLTADLPRRRFLLNFVFNVAQEFLLIWMKNRTNISSNSRKLKV